MKTLGKIQLGKNGVTENFISDLKNRFKTHKNLKVSILRSCCRDKKELVQIRDEILKILNSRPRTKLNDGYTSTTKSLGKKFTAKIIGYTLALKKWRREKED